MITCRYRKKMGTSCPKGERAFLLLSGGHSIQNALVFFHMITRSLLMTSFLARDKVICTHLNFLEFAYLVFCFFFKKTILCLALDIVAYVQFSITFLKQVRIKKNFFFAQLFNSTFWNSEFTKDVI